MIFKVKGQGHRVKLLGEGIRHALCCPCLCLYYKQVIKKYYCRGLGGLMSKVVGLPNNSYKPITNTAQLAVASDKVYQLLAYGLWFSPGTPASSTTKTGHHDIAEILQKVALNTKNHHHQSSICTPCETG